jgi:hypothetical protein
LKARISTFQPHRNDDGQAVRDMQVEDKKCVHFLKRRKEKYQMKQLYG